MFLPSRPTYRIIDARQPSRVGHLAVNPYFPLLSLMLGGGWIGWPWFAFNAVALGSYTRTREIVVSAAAAAGVPALALALGYLYTRGLFGETAFPYCQLLVVVLKLSCGYFVNAWQERASQLREHFDSPLRNGMGVVVAATWLRFQIEPQLVAHNLQLLDLVLMV
jgi:hypothetical protein